VGYELRKFVADDWHNIDVQPGQQIDKVIGLSDPMLDSVVQLEHSFTLVKDSEILICAGVIPIWYGRAAVWALLSSGSSGSGMIKIHRETTKFINGVQEDSAYRRLEMHVDSCFKAAHKWAIMLGFTPEGEMQCFDPTGRDCWLYSRIIR